MNQPENELRPGLPPLPERLRHLVIDERGFPVPWFVAWFDGKPDHRVINKSKVAVAHNRSLCWMCGQQLGVHKTFPIGPMCSITRTIAEPPSHLDCARYAAKACPWITRPHAKRREAALPDEELTQAPGMIKRNPGVLCLWTTRSYKPYHPGKDPREVLFELGDPEHTEWYAEGRPALRSEVLESIKTGLPLLLEQCHGEQAAVHDLSRAVYREYKRIGEYPFPDESPRVDCAVETSHG
jgi:hypothetical protein